MRGMNICLYKCTLLKYTALLQSNMNPTQEMVPRMPPLIPFNALHQAPYEEEHSDTKLFNDLDIQVQLVQLIQRRLMNERRNMEMMMTELNKKRNETSRTRSEVESEASGSVPKRIRVCSPASINRSINNIEEEKDSDKGSEEMMSSNCSDNKLEQKTSEEETKLS